MSRLYAKMLLKYYMHYLEYLYMSYKQRRVLMKAFIHSQFGYCPLIWMFHSRRSNNRREYLKDLFVLLIEMYIAPLMNFSVKITLSQSMSETQFLAIKLYKVQNTICPCIYKRFLPPKR